MHGRLLTTTCALGLALAAPTAADAAVPTNDAFANAQAITTPASIAGSVNEATAEAGEPQHAKAKGKATVWYAFTAPESRPYLLDTCTPEFDTTLAVYEGTAVGGLREVASNDDACGRGSQLTFAAEAGKTYRIAVAAFDAAVEKGKTGFTLRLGPLVRPVNDAYARAIRLTGPGRVRASNVLTAPAEVGEPRHFRGAAGASVWYRFTATRTQRLTLDTFGSDFDTVLAVYTGSLPGLRLLASNDDARGSSASEVTFTARKGRTYRIAVDGSEGDDDPTGDFELGLSDGGARGTGLSVTVPAGQSLTSVRSGGLDASLRCVRSCRVDIQLRVGAQTARRLGLGNNRVIATSAGRLTPGDQERPATLVLSRKAKRALAGASSLSATLAVRLLGTDAPDRVLKQTIDLQG